MESNKEVAMECGMKRIAPVPHYVLASQIQRPDGRLAPNSEDVLEKQFDVTNLEWQIIVEKGKRCKIAAIPNEKDWEAMFLRGERAEGETVVSSWSKGRSQASSVLDKVGRCKYGKLIGRERNSKLTQTALEAAASKRRSAIAHAYR
jgi:hypothetical protein